MSAGTKTLNNIRYCYCYCNCYCYCSYYCYCYCYCGAGTFSGGFSRDLFGVIFPFWWCLVMAGRGKANTYAVSYLGGLSRFDVFSTGFFPF